MNDKNYIFKLQPRRDERFLFRTHPLLNKSRHNFFKTTKIEYIRCMCALYNWSTNEFQNRIIAKHLHQYLFGEFTFGPEKIVSPKTLGRVILQSTVYDPRLIVIYDFTKTVTYHFWHQNDLAYGLEWMLTSWLQQLPSVTKTPVGILEAFEKIQNDQYYFIDEVENSWLDEPDWKSLEEENLVSFYEHKKDSYKVDVGKEDPPWEKLYDSPPEGTPATRMTYAESS